MKNIIFVFGSNLAGKHGKGGALYAKNNYGAVYGVGHGRTGDSYAIPTKDRKLNTLPLYLIQQYITKFEYYVQTHPELEFYVTPIGTGLAGYSLDDIAPMLKSLLKYKNVLMLFKYDWHLLDEKLGEEEEPVIRWRA